MTCRVKLVIWSVQGICLNPSSCTWFPSFIFAQRGRGLPSYIEPILLPTRFWPEGGRLPMMSTATPVGVSEGSHGLGFHKVKSPHSYSSVSKSPAPNKSLQYEGNTICAIKIIKSSRKVVINTLFPKGQIPTPLYYQSPELPIKFEFVYCSSKLFHYFGSCLNQR